METTGESSPEFYNNAGIALAEQGERAKAIEAFENALRLKPDFGAARRNLARLYADMALDSIENGDYAGAEMPLKRAIALFPEKTAFAIQLGVVLNRLGRDEEAILVYERVLAREPDAKEARVNLARSYNNLGVAKIKLGDWEGALADFDAALHYEPTLELARDNRKTALWKWADAIKDTDPARSLKILQAYLRDDPDAVEAHVAMGILYAKYDDYVNAIAAFKRAYELDPTEQNRKNLAITYHQHGTRLAQTGQHEAAIRQFEEGLAVAPGDLNLLRSLGLAYRDAGRMDEAASTFQTILQRDPNDEWARQALVNLALAAGNEAYKRRDFKRAIHEFERVPESARTASVYGLLGYLYLETEQHEKAIDALGRALLLTPDDRTARTNLEFCTKQLKKEMEAGGDPRISYALIRAESYQLAARIARRMHKTDLGRFLKRLQQPGTDQETIRALQDCALAVAKAAADSAPNEAREIVRAALALNPHHIELNEWLEENTP